MNRYETFTTLFSYHGENAYDVADPNSHFSPISPPFSQKRSLTSKNHKRQKNRRSFARSLAPCNESLRNLHNVPSLSQRQHLRSFRLKLTFLHNSSLFSQSALHDLRFDRPLPSFARDFLCCYRRFSSVLSRTRSKASRSPIT